MVFTRLTSDLSAVPVTHWEQTHMYMCLQQRCVSVQIHTLHVYYEYLVLQMVKSLKCCTRHTLSGHHIGCLAEEEGPPACSRWTLRQ